MTEDEKNHLPAPDDGAHDAVPGSRADAAPRSSEPVPGQANTSKSSAGGGSLGSPSDALTAFEQVIAEAKQAEEGQSGPRVSSAFALGWQMAEVYEPGRGVDRITADDDLPGVSSLQPNELQELQLYQLQAGITKLKDSITGAGLKVPDAEDFSQTLKNVSEPSECKQQIRDFHVQLLSTPTAADCRLGKAYGLGRALADTTRKPGRYQLELRWLRLTQLTDWVRQLATAFPPHSAHPVAKSLEAWSRFSSAEQTAAEEEGRSKLPAQGRLWRSLLSGEKRPEETLETDNYLSAGEGMLQRSAALIGRFLRHYWWLVLLVLVLFGVGVGVVTGTGKAAAVGAGAASLLASVGLSWRGVGKSLATVTSQLEQPIWQAELDQVIYMRITPQAVLTSQGNLEEMGPDEPSLVPVKEDRNRPCPIEPKEEAGE